MRFEEIDKWFDINKEEIISIMLVYQSFITTVNSRYLDFGYLE